MEIRRKVRKRTAEYLDAKCKEIAKVFKREYIHRQENILTLGGKNFHCESGEWYLVTNKREIPE